MASHTLFVTTDHDGWALERFIADELPDLDRRWLRKMILGGSVLVNREAGWLGRKMRSGERVSVPAESDSGPKVPDVEVLLRDDAFIVVNKPAGIPVVPDRAGEVPSLIEILREREDEAFVVHRIDKGASGALVVALDRASHRALSLQFQNREVGKEYLALVAGEPDEDEGTIELPIGHDPREKMRMRTDRNVGKLSTTRFRVRERFRDYALVEAMPETGRTHQIRVHMAGIGHALAIDPTYGSREEIHLSDLKPGYRPKKRGTESALMNRLTLHARALRFTHPVSGEEVFVECPLPEDLTLFLKMLRKYRPWTRSEDD